MDNSNITPEFKQKAEGKTRDEIVALAQEEGIELSDEQLERVSGGWVGVSCPSCGRMDVNPSNDLDGLECSRCGYKWVP